MPDFSLSRRVFLEKFAKLVELPVIPEYPVQNHQPEVELGAITLSGDLTPYTGVWDFQHAAHLLRRATFGVKKAQVDQLVALGDAQSAVDYVLDVPQTAPAPPINNYNNPEYTDADVPPGQTWVNAPPDFNNGGEGYRIESWRGWWLNLMIDGDANIREKMTLFWHNHFATQTSIVFLGRWAYSYNQLLRANALGNFKNLTRDVTIHPMMLYYLNGFLNTESAPDENYARELQELFTVGKDSVNQYTEDDVVAAARVLTGWRLDYNTLTSFFNPAEHDSQSKTFSSFYNGATIAGSDFPTVELNALLDMIFAKEEVSLFICRKIYRFFVYYKIDQTVEDTIIAPLAQIFRDNNYDVKPVMETLLKSEHFFDAYNKGCYIKNPMDHVVGILRNFNQSINAPTLLDGYIMSTYINYTTAALQMQIGDPPNVAGWPAYRQTPNFYRNWISADTIRNRNIFTDVMVLYYYATPNDTYLLNVDSVEFAKQFDHPEDPVQLVNDIVGLLLPVDLSVYKKFLLKSILLSGQASDYYWTDAWNAYIGNPGDQMAYDTVKYRLSLLNKYITSLAEYQLA